MPVTIYGEQERPKEQSLRRQLIRAGSAGVMLRVLSVLAGLVSSVALARMLGPQQYGIYAFVLAILAILSIPMQVGLPTLVLRVTAQSTALSEWPTLRGIWSWAAGVVLAGSAVVIGLFLIWVTFAANTLTEAQRAALLIGLAQAPLLAAGQVRSAALRGFKRIWLAGLPEDVLRPVMLAMLVLCAGVFFYNGNVTAQTAMGLAVVAALLSFLLGTVFLWRSRPRALVESTARQFEHRRWLRSIFSLSLIAGVSIIMQNVDILMLAFMRSDVEVGEYRVAVSIATLALFGWVVIDIVIKPYLAEAYANNDRDRLQMFAQYAVVTASIFAITLLPLLWIFGDNLITAFYGPQYVNSFAPLLFLITARSISTGFGLNGSLLTMSGYENKILVPVLAAALLNALLNFFLIPIYGTTGAAISTGASHILYSGAQWVQVRRHLKIESSIFVFFSSRANTKRFR